jgi:hypothetical protein
MLRYAENSKRSQRKNKNHPVMLAKTRDLRENNSPDVQRHHSQIIPRHVLRDPRLSGARVPHHAIELGDATPRPIICNQIIITRTIMQYKLILKIFGILYVHIL